MIRSVLPRGLAIAVMLVATVGSTTAGATSERSLPNRNVAAGATAVAGERPPTCVNVIVDDTKQQVITENLCENTVSVKIIIAFGWDSDCRVIPPFRSDFYFYNNSGRYDGIEVCG